MIIKKIRLQNIRSYEDQEVEFPLGSFLLAGDAGAGKTSLLLAIEYALFGLQPGQNSAGLLRNKAQAGAVDLELEIDGREILIERKLRRGTKTITNEYAAITLEGKKHECSVTELKAHVLKLLGYPLEFIKKNNLLYRYTIYTPQEQMKHIIIEDPEARLTIIRHIFGIDKYKLIRENTQKVITYLKEDSKEFQALIKNFEQDVKRLTEIQDSLKNISGLIIERGAKLSESIRERKEKEKDLQSLREKAREKERLENEIDKTKVMISSKKEAFVSLEKEYQEIQATIAKTVPFEEKLYLATLETIKEKKQSLSNLQERYIQIKSQIQAMEQQQRESKTKKDKIFIIDVCPTCLQDIPEVHKHNVLNATEQTITALQRQISSLSEEDKQLIHMMEQERKGLQDIERKKTEYEIIKSNVQFLELSQRKSHDILKLKESHSRDIRLLEQHCEILKEDLSQFSRFLNTLKVKEEELKRMFSEEKKNEIQLAEAKKEQELLNKELERLQTILDEKEIVKKRLATTLETIDWLAQNFLTLMNLTESSVLMKIRGEFSKLFSKWFHMLAGEQFEVKIDETFTPIILQGDHEMDYSFLSGGERTAVALAYRLALNQTINSVLSHIKTKEIIILDEPTEGFSETQLERMREVLAELQVRQLIIVSHEQKIEGFVENVIKIKKEDGLSVKE
ncbi:hypothetical protein FJZ18_03865 [Candidatus Pacearchaeota archaeon]|nr:hypothetical protein [Candidatus Pacearchaeota archaeon]